MPALTLLHQDPIFVRDRWEICLRVAGILLSLAKTFLLRIEMPPNMEPLGKASALLVYFPVKIMTKPDWILGLARKWRTPGISCVGHARRVSLYCRSPSEIGSACYGAPAWGRRARRRDGVVPPETPMSGRVSWDRWARAPSRSCRASRACAYRASFWSPLATGDPAVRMYNARQAA